MPLTVTVMKREITSTRFDLSIRWALTGAHQNGLLVQKVQRLDTQLVGFRRVQAVALTYWEAWLVANYVVHGYDAFTHQPMLIPAGASHDTFAGPAAGVGGTRILGNVYWIDAASAGYAVVPGLMPVGTVQAASPFLRSTTADPLTGVDAPQLLARDEFFLYEVF